MYSGRQEQDGEPPISLHWEKGPHGVGMHGLTYIGGRDCGGGAVTNGTLLMRTCLHYTQITDIIQVSHSQEINNLICNIHITVYYYSVFLFTIIFI